MEGITQNTKVLGNTRPAPPPLGECAVALGRYAVLFSTAPRPLRLSALQNACVCPCMGAYYNAELGNLQINASMIFKNIMKIFSFGYFRLEMHQPLFKLVHSRTTLLLYLTCHSHLVLLLFHLIHHFQTFLITPYYQLCSSHHYWHR